MVIKTREKLIEVARQLFARKGLENTTMNDIANASDKGRRTLYTYFKNKREIYNAVIERESDQLVTRLRDIVALPIDPVDKLVEYLNTRFEIVEDTVKRASTTTLRTRFTLDFRRLDRIRRLAVSKEQQLFNALLSEGVREGKFDARQAERLGAVETMIFQGVDYSHLRNNFQEIELSRDELKNKVINYLVDGIVIKTGINS